MAKAEVEVITSERRRRHWSRADKERIVAAALQPGATILGVARAFGVHSSQVFRWRQQLCGKETAVPGFAAVTIAANPDLHGKRRSAPTFQLTAWSARSAVRFGS
ncbi:MULTISPECIES: transposase [unclassified Bradyrhizobium]|nr:MULTISPECIES: transposase [unclassified Bradyrhizobium]